MSIKQIPIAEDLRKCPECGVESKFLIWIPMEIECEDCGSHPAVSCPNCNKIFDLIFHDFIHFSEIL